MWQLAMAINTVIWALLGVLLVYCAGTALLDGEWRRFIFVFMFWGISNMTIIIFAIKA